MTDPQALTDIFADAEQLTIVCHNNPDPDCLASALAFVDHREAAGATVDAIATAIGNRRIRSGVLISHVGRTAERDALPQAADYLADEPERRAPDTSDTE